MRGSRWIWLWSALSVLGCTRLGYEGRSGDSGFAADSLASADGPAVLPDASRDAASPLRIGPGDDWTLEAPQPLEQLNSQWDEMSPSLSRDGLTFFFSSARAPHTSNNNLYVATRPSREALFGSPQPYTAVDTEHYEGTLVFSADELIVALSSDRPGGLGESDIWLARRSSASDPLTNALFTPAANLNSADQDYDPWLTNDGLGIYFATRGPPDGALGDMELVFSQRSSRDDPFAAPTLIVGLNSAAKDDNPTLTSDELVVVFGSTRPGTVSDSQDIWFATRDSPMAPWSQPKLLPVINTEAYEGESCISADGREIIFVSDRPEGLGRWDLYHSRVIAKY